LQRMALVTYVEDVQGLGRLGEIFVDPPDYAILNPVAPGRANLSVVVPLAHAMPWSGRLDAFFAARVKQLPHLARRIAGGHRVAPVRAMGPLAYRVDVPRVGGVLVVGDAVGFFDPFTGEGIFKGLRSAELAGETAVRALARGGGRAGSPVPARGRRVAWSTRERDQTLGRFLTMLGAVPVDSVLVLAAHDNVAAHFGELSASWFRARKVRGAVIDGATRDTAAIVRMGFPTFVRYRTPQDSVPRCRVADWGRPVPIGGLRRSLGD